MRYSGKYSLNQLLISEATLQGSDVFRRPGRVDTFIQRMDAATNKEDAAAFTLNADREKKVWISKSADGYANAELYKALKDGNRQAYNAALRKGVLTIAKDGSEVVINSGSDLFKDKQIGGGGDTTSKEKGQIKQIKEAIISAGGGSPINIKLGNGFSGGLAEDVIDVRNVDGTPKADCALVNSAGEDVGYISLKFADQPRGMQNWAGVTNYGSHPEVQKYVEALRSYVDLSEDGRIPRGMAVVKLVEDPELSAKLTFGNQKRPENNCDLIIISKSRITLSPAGEGQYEFQGDKIYYARDPIQDAEWAPALTATYRSDRDNFGIPTTRVGAYPFNWRSEAKKIIVDDSFLADIENQQAAKNADLGGRQDLEGSDKDSAYSDRGGVDMSGLYGQSNEALRKKIKLILERQSNMKKYRIKRKNLALVIEAIRYIHADSHGRRLMREACGDKYPEEHVDPDGRMMDYGHTKSDSHEGRMTKAKLFRMAQMAQRLHDKLVDGDDLPGWVADKVTTAEDRLMAAHNYILYKIHRLENR